MAHTPPYPAAAISDADYVTKMQANMDYFRDVFILQQLVGADLSTSAALASGQIAQYGLAGSSLGTGASGVPTAALMSGSVTEVKHAMASIIEGDIDYTSCKFVRTGATGIWVARGTVVTTFTVSAAAPAVVVNIDISAAGISDEITSIASTDQGFCWLGGSGDPGKPLHILTVVSGVNLTATAYSVETISNYAGTFHWLAVGTA